ncbi:DUF2982 domain-containing protein [Corallincola platygyrae]|uniref:DUF2982 domain-containing protein n=1 Tax=Corallincola platygyrae TaxID=1193278 RepID=A0ABW4XKE1_9GAMM
MEQSLESLDSLDTIEIQPVVNRFGPTLTLLGGSAALLVILALSLVDGLPKLPFYVMLGGALFTLLLGILKCNEPKVSLRLCPNYLQFFHKHGQWTLKWEDIQRIDVPKLGISENYEALNYVGLKLSSHHLILSNISLRLARSILLEQRPVLMQAIKSDCPDGTCPTDLLFEADEFTDEQGEHYNGLLAMLGHRMAHLRQMLGFDLYLPATALDRPLEEFVTLLRRYHSQVQQQDA